MWGFYGQSWFILGSEDIRRGGGFAIQYSRSEPRFTIWKKKAKLVLEANYANTVGGNKFEWSPDRTQALGALALIRFETRPTHGLSTYIEAGWGFQYADKLTIDLPSRWNSTPTLGAGIMLPLRDREIYIGIRWIHISNGGTVGNNPGQNQILGMVGFRF